MLRLCWTVLALTFVAGLAIPGLRAQEKTLDEEFNPRGARHHGHKHGHGHHGHKHHGHHHGHKHGPVKKKSGKKKQAHVHSHGPAHDHFHDDGRGHPRGHAHLETENMFGFTTGSDVGHVGETHLALDSIWRLGKRDGSYMAWSKKLEAGITPLPNFHFAVGASTAYHRISGVTGLDDRRQYEFDGVSAEFKYRLLDRATAPIGMTLIFEPHVARFEEVSGEPVLKYAAEFKLAADAELLRERIYAAFNLLYEPERVRIRGTDEVEKESTLGLSGALTAQVVKDVFLGGELRYFRKYEGLGLDTHVGHALFAGPTLYAKLSENWWLTAAWSVQVAGRSVDTPDLNLDLEHFTRHQAKLKLVGHF
jgi:hypothetical protein